MIHYLVTRRHAYTMRNFLAEWGRELAGRVRLLPYEDLPRQSRLMPGTYIFSDLERLGAWKIDLAEQVWEQLTKADDSVRLLNHPRRVLRRAALLRLLRERGINRFGACPATDSLEDCRYPVFVRPENDHSGSLSTLLHDPNQVRQAISAAEREGWLRRDLLVVEHLHAADAEGIFRKYAAFRVGDRIIPRHVIFGRQWVLKRPDLIDEDKVREERVYLETNPHEAQLREVFDAAQIEYGRIDYGVVNGSVQVWEINTNPEVMLPREVYDPRHLPSQEWFAPNIIEALKAIDLTLSEAVPVRLRPGVGTRLKAVWPAELAAYRARRLRRRLSRLIRQQVGDGGVVEEGGAGGDEHPRTFARRT